MNRSNDSVSQSQNSEFKQLPQMFFGVSEGPDMMEIPKTPRSDRRSLLNFQETSFATEQNYYAQNFSFEEMILLVLFVLNSIIYFNFQKDVQSVIYCQIFIALINVFMLIGLDTSSSTIPLLLVIIATLLALVVAPLFRQIRQFMLIPLLYLLGFKGIRSKGVAIYKAVKKQSIWMFLSIALLFYVFGYISFNIFWRNQKNFKTPIHSSISLLQVSTFDGLGEIVSRVAAVSGLATSFGILIFTLAVFQLLYNINQALIIQYVHEKQIVNNMNALFMSLIQIYGIPINIDVRIFRYINIFSTSAVFVIPFQPDLIWVYCVLSGISTVAVLLFEFAKGNIFGYRSILNVGLQTCIVVTAVIQAHNICFLLCCFRIFLIKQIINLWKKIKKVIQKVYPMLSLIIVFYIIFAMLVFCIQKESLENTFITGLQLLALDDWTNHVRSYPWYMKIILLSYMLIGSHLLLNSLVSQAFNELQDHADLSIDSRMSDSLIESFGQLPPQKKFVSILKQLRFEGLNQFKGSTNKFFNGTYEEEEEYEDVDQGWDEDEQIDEEQDEGWSEIKQEKIKDTADIMNIIDGISVDKIQSKSKRNYSESIYSDDNQSRGQYSRSNRII